MLGASSATWQRSQKDAGGSEEASTPPSASLGPGGAASALLVVLVPPHAASDASAKIRAVRRGTSIGRGRGFDRWSEAPCAPPPGLLLRGRGVKVRGVDAAP